VIDVQTLFIWGGVTVAAFFLCRWFYREGFRFGGNPEGAVDPKNPFLAENEPPRPNRVRYPGPGEVMPGYSAIMYSTAQPTSYIQPFKTAYSAKRLIEIKRDLEASVAGRFP